MKQTYYIVYCKYIVLLTLNRANILSELMKNMVQMHFLGRPGMAIHVAVRITAFVFLHITN